ncbi:MAG: exosortase/archaeosortase family protein, partial [Planctomycetes bacterium]|nr:exosortase/archaeosortase family protein [Planctomycetota bacterium]
MTRMSSISTAPAAPAPLAAAPRAALGQLAALAAVLGWAYWPMLRVFADKWLNDPQYSHGLLVPFFSAYLIRRAWTTGAPVLKPLPLRVEVNGRVVCEARLGLNYRSLTSNGSGPQPCPTRPHSTTGR